MTTTVFRTMGLFHSLCVSMNSGRKELMNTEDEREREKRTQDGKRTPRIRNINRIVRDFVFFPSLFDLYSMHFAQIFDFSMPIPVAAPVFFSPFIVLINTRVIISEKCHCQRVYMYRYVLLNNKKSNNILNQNAERRKKKLQSKKKHSI